MTLSFLLKLLLSVFTWGMSKLDKNQYAWLASLWYNLDWERGQPQKLAKQTVELLFLSTRDFFSHRVIIDRIQF